MFSPWTASRSGCGSRGMRFEIMSWPGPFLRGAGQIIFCGNAAAGVLVVFGIAMLAPWTALGLLLGVATGTALGRIDASLPAAAWRDGLAGFNPGIVGMLWAGPLARADATATLLPLALLSVVALDSCLRAWFGRARFPQLAASALLVGWASDWTFRALGDSLWSGPAALLPSGDVSLALGVAALIGAIGIVSVPAALVTASAGGFAALLSGWWYGLPDFGPAGLWAFSVTPSALGAFVLVPVAGVVALRAALTAGGIAATVWFVWVSSPAAHLLPPLLAPCLVGIWTALGLCMYQGGRLMLHPGVWILAEKLRACRARGDRAVVLTGAGVSTASGIPDYVTGGWLDPAVPTSAYTFQSFVSSPRCRRLYWDACAQFRALSHAARPNAAHRALAELQRNGWIAAIVTQNVDGLHQAAGSSHVIELHGQIDRIRCIACGEEGKWNDRLPSGGELLCPSCGGLLKPAVIAMGEDIPTAVLRSAEQTIASCGLLVVAGTQMAISSASGLLALARRRGADVVFINIGPMVQPVGPTDLFLQEPVEDGLHALAGILGKGRAPASPPFPQRVLDRLPLSVSSERRPK